MQAGIVTQWCASEWLKPEHYGVNTSAMRISSERSDAFISRAEQPWSYVYWSTID